MATCPECEFDDIDTADHEEGDTLSCPECGKNLVLLGADELDFADSVERFIDRKISRKKLEGFEYTYTALLDDQPAKPIRRPRRPTGRKRK